MNREITNFEKKLIIDTYRKNIFSFNNILFILVLIVPIIVLLILSYNYIYLSILIILLLILIYQILIKPYIIINKVLKNNIKCFDSKVINCKKNNWYYYLVEINDKNNEFIPYKYCVSKKINTNNPVVVVMINGKNNKKKYILIDKNNNKVLTNNKTRYDII